MYSPVFVSSLLEAHIYLVYGADEGELAKKVMDRLRDDPNENIFKIYGHINCNYSAPRYHVIKGNTYTLSVLSDVISEVFVF
jgi:hypothetical protein